MVFFFVLYFEAILTLIVSLKYGRIPQGGFPSVGSARLHLFLGSLKFDHSVASIRLVRVGPLRDLSGFYRVDTEKVPRHVVKNSDARHVIHGFQMLETPGFHKVKVLLRVETRLIARLVVQRVVRPVKVVKVIERQIVIEMGLAHRQGSLVCPAARHIFDCVATATQEHSWQTPRLDKSDACAMRLDRSIMCAKPVPS